MFRAKEIKEQTREEKIEIFDRNQMIANLEGKMYGLESDMKRVEDIFLELLDKNNSTYVVDKPTFLFEGNPISIVTRLAEENEIIDYFSKFKKVFIYTIMERPKTLYSSDKALVIRYAVIE